MEVIRSFVLLEVGDLCTEEKRAETERILRLQPFLADVAVRTVAADDGGVRVEVETIDEIPTVFGIGVDGMVLSAIRFGNGNVRGQGLYLAANVERGFAYRTEVGVEVRAYQAFGRPVTLSFVAERASLGSTLSIDLSRPFLTDLQRTAWHVGFRDLSQYLSFVPPEGEELALHVERQFWDVGAVRRLGIGQYSAFIGGLVTSEAVVPAGRFVIASDSGLVADTSGALSGPLVSYRNLRLNVVVGIRALSFMPVRGFDALSAVQDVATGIQLGAVVGRGISRTGAHGIDHFVAADLYLGRGSDRSFVAVKVEGEARADSRAGGWDSVLGSGRLAWYLKPAARHVAVASVEFGGGWRQRVPFQLMLGDLEGGVRGYADSRLAGATRTVVRFEERWSIGRLTRHGALGLSTFADAGWVWAGDAPFGTQSGIKTGVGVGLLAAFPPESTRLWRVDFAMPVSRDPNAGWEIRVSSSWTRSFWREPRDVASGRAGASPSTIFSWP
jgi:hypothetical protein